MTEDRRMAILKVYDRHSGDVYGHMAYRLGSEDPGIALRIAQRSKTVFLHAHLLVQTLANSTKYKSVAR